MQTVSTALGELKALFPKVLGRPAPEIGSHAYSPFPPGVDPAAHVVEEVEHLKRLSERIGSAPKPVAWVPRMDSFVGKDALLVRLEVPGVSREHLQVFVVGAECVVRGNRSPGDNVELRPVALELPWGPFERRFLLPAGAQAERLTAEYRNGILELRVALADTATRKETKIDVR